jgi:hypothetical protein
MSRLLRSTAISRLRPPNVVAPATTFRPVLVRLTRTPLPQPRAPHSRLRPPAVVAPAITFRPVSTKVVWLPTRQVLGAHPHLSKPAVVAPAVTFAPVRVTTAAATRANITTRRQSRYWLKAPITSVPVFVASAIRTVLSATKQARQGTAAHPRLSKPAVVAPAVTFRPLSVTTATAASLYPVRRQSRYRLYPPTILSTFVASAIRVVQLVTKKTRPATHSRLRPPAVVAPAVTFRPVGVTTSIARANTTRRTARSSLKPPTVVSTVVPPPPVTPVSSGDGMIRRRHPNDHLAGLLRDDDELVLLIHSH